MEPVHGMPCSDGTRTMEPAQGMLWSDGTKMMEPAHGMLQSDGTRTMQLANGMPQSDGMRMMEQVHGMPQSDGRRINWVHGRLHSGPSQGPHQCPHGHQVPLDIFGARTLGRLGRELRPGQGLPPQEGSPCWLSLGSYLIKVV